MDLIRLNASTYLPDGLIENFSTLIWTERYFVPGDFKVTFADVPQGMLSMPLDSLISLLDTRVVMVVEDYLIEANADGEDVLTVTGRSIDAVYLYDRVAADDVTTPTPNPWQINTTSAGFAIANVLEYILNLGRLSSYDNYPNMKVLLSGTPTPDAREYSVKLGTLNDSVNEMLKDAKYGLITERRGYNDFRGPGINLYIYTGVDRTATSTTYPPVIFSYDAGHFESVTYFQSTRDIKNIAYVFSPLDSIKVTAPGVSSAVSGYNRKVLFVDASDISSVKTGQTIAGLLKQRGLSELAKHNTGGVVFEGKISPNVPYRYFLDYACGDTVTVQAKYGVRKSMRVTEYIRNQDINGEQSYPTLTDI